MKMSDVFPARFVKAEDLAHDVKVTIKNVVMESVYDAQAKEEVDKPIVYFERANKGLLLNKTNARMIADSYGDESDAWTGKEVILTTVEVHAFGDVVRAIRIKIPKANGYAPSPEAAAAVAELFPEPTMPTTTTKEPVNG